MTETARNPLATALGTYYPKHYLVAVFDDPSRAVEAIAALRKAGFPDAEAELCPGPEFQKNYRDFATHRTIVQRAADLFPAEEHTAVEEYLAEAERGASFVTVYSPDRIERGRAAAILHAHDGHAMRYYGDHTITDVHTQTWAQTLATTVPVVTAVTGANGHLQPTPKLDPTRSRNGLMPDETASRTSLGSWAGHKEAGLTGQIISTNLSGEQEEKLKEAFASA